MNGTRLSPLDASFLDVETPTAHMHVGWVALFAPPPGGATFEELRDHVAARLARAPRYRQRLAHVPLGLSEPVWIDDEDFSIGRHVFRATASDVGAIADAVLSVPLARDRPLWELWIADDLADGRIAVIGKAHHCMVDGVAAVELASLLLDPEPVASTPPADRWLPERPPDALRLATGALLDRVRTARSLTTAAIRIAWSPRQILTGVGAAERVARTLARVLRPAPRVGALNEEISPLRMLARVRRPLGDLEAIRARHGVSLNDVVLAVTAGAVRRFLTERGDVPVRLKAMVPVNVRAKRPGGMPGELGNHISFMFVELPCEEADPLKRLRDVTLATRVRKRAGDAEVADTAVQLLGYAPGMHQVVSRLASSPRTFNLVVSNIPGPREPLYMHGCELQEAYPVVPLAERHGLSIGFTAIRDEACFGIYADRASLPDAGLLTQDIADAVDELRDVPSAALDLRARHDVVSPV